MSHRNLIKAVIAAGVSSVIFAATISLQAQDFRVEKTMVKVADDVKLVTKTYLPKQNGKYPTVLIRTPYGSQNMTWIAEYLPLHGYAVVVQDVRGKNGSGGQFFPFAYEKADGIATLKWVLQQPFCNGEVGLWGVSYLGFAANEMASTGHPAVKAVFLLSGWSELDSFITHGGAFHLMAHLPWFVMFAGEQNPPAEASLEGVRLQYDQRRFHGRGKITTHGERGHTTPESTRLGGGRQIPRPGHETTAGSHGRHT